MSNIIALKFTTGADTVICYYSCNNYNLQEAIVLAGSYLSPEEKDYLANLQVDRRRLSYLLGRIAAKDVLQKPCNATKAMINIQAGIFGQPIVTNFSEFRLSISHSDHFGAALAFHSCYPMAIDIEELSLGREGAIKSQLSPAEIKFFGGLQYGYIMAWTIKEALSKVLLTGLTTSFLIYEISEIIAHQGMYVAKFHNFPQYQVLTFCQNNIILSLVLPKQLQIDQASILQLQKLFC